MEETAVTVDAVHDIGPDAIELVLETPAGFDAQPGQFVKLLADVDGEDESRFYTISSPDVVETFALTIEVDPDGAISPLLEELDAGSTVTLSGPYGNAYYEGESDVLIIAGGPGIGPAVGIAERTLDDGGTAAIVYRDADPIHTERLEALSDQGVSLHVIDDGESLVEPVTKQRNDRAQVFVYGFAEFLDDAMDAVAAANGEPDETKVENFG